MTTLPPGIPLFRKEVIERRANVLYGTTLLPPPRLVRQLSLASLALVAAIFAALASARYTPHIAATGQLAHVPGDAVLRSPRTGVVARLHAENGAIVQAGSPLVEIRSARSYGGIADVEERIADGLRAELDHLRHQIQTGQALLDAELRAARSELRVVEKDLAGLAKVADMAARKLEMANRAAVRLRSLAGRGLVPRTAVEDAESAVLAAEIALQEVDQRINREAARRLALLSTIEALPLRKQQRSAELARHVESVRLRLTEAESQRAVVLRAPFAGRVTRRLVAAGQSVSSGTELLTVVAQDAQLRAELDVPTRAAGFIEPGMPVRMRFDAFPYQQFGQHPGAVVTLDQVASSPNGTRHEPVYRVEVALEHAHVESAQGPAALRAGMTLSADILQPPRRLLDWLLDPLKLLHSA